MWKEPVDRLVLVAPARHERREDGRRPLEGDQRLPVVVHVDPLVVLAELLRRRSGLRLRPVDGLHPPALVRLPELGAADGGRLAREPDGLEALRHALRLRRVLARGVERPLAAPPWSTKPTGSLSILREGSVLVAKLAASLPSHTPWKSVTGLVTKMRSAGATSPAIVFHHIAPDGPELVIERQEEALDHAARDGAVRLLQVLQRDRRRPGVRRLLLPPRGVRLVAAGVLADRRRGGGAAVGGVRRAGGGVGVVVVRSRLRALGLGQPGLELEPLLARGDLAVERRAVGDVDPVGVRDGPVQIRRLRELEAGMLEVERDVLAAHEAAGEELVPPLGAVGLLVRLGDDRRPLAVAEVAEAAAAAFPDGLLRGELHLGVDGGLHHRRANPRTFVGAGVGRAGRGGGGAGRCARAGARRGRGGGRRRRGRHGGRRRSLLAARGERERYRAGPAAYDDDGTWQAARYLVTRWGAVGPLL